MAEDTERLVRIAKSALVETYTGVAKQEGISNDRVRQIMLKMIRRAAPEYSRRKVGEIRANHEFIAARIDEWHRTKKPVSDFKDWREGLSNRSGNVLRAEGFTSKEQVREALESGTLAIRSGSSGVFHNGNKVPNLGKKSFKEVCEWAGVDSPRQEASQESINRSVLFLERAGYKVVPPDG